VEIKGVGPVDSQGQEWEEGKGQAPLGTIATSASVHDEVGLMSKHHASCVSLQHLERDLHQSQTLRGSQEIAKCMALTHEIRPRNSVGDEPFN